MPSRMTKFRKAANTHVGTDEGEWERSWTAGESIMVQ